MKKISKSKKSRLLLDSRLLVLAVCVVLTGSLAFGWFSSNRLLYGNDINLNVDDNAKVEISVSSGEMPDLVS